MKYGVAVCARGSEPTTQWSRQLFGKIVEVEADGPRRAKKAAKHIVRTTGEISKPMVLGVRLLSRHQFN